jgi:hypothetical protein
MLRSFCLGRDGLHPVPFFVSSDKKTRVAEDARANLQDTFEEKQLKDNRFHIVLQINLKTHLEELDTNPGKYP